MGGAHVGESTGVYTHNPLGGMREEVFFLVYSKGTQCLVVTFQVTTVLIV